MDGVLERVLVRLPEAANETALLNEFISTISDRLLLRLGADTLPSVFNSVLVDAVVKMYRRIYYEGIKNESAATLSSSFVDDILSEYDYEVTSYKEQQANSGNTDKVVRFL